MSGGRSTRIDDPTVSSVFLENHAEEVAGPLVLWIYEHLIGRAVFNDDTLVHEHDTIGHPPGRSRSRG